MVGEVGDHSIQDEYIHDTDRIQSSAASVGGNSLGIDSFHHGVQRQGWGNNELNNCLTPFPSYYPEHNNNAPLGTYRRASDGSVGGTGD